MQLRRDITRLREHAGMTRFCESKPTSSILEAVVKLEELGFTAYLLSVPEYNKRTLEGRVKQVKKVLNCFNYPYNRRIAGAHGRFSKEDYSDWLQNVEIYDLARAIRRLAQLDQPKVYLFWKK